MISQTSEEMITTVPASAAKTSNQSTKPRKLNARMFDFLWWRDSRRENELKKEEKQKKNEELIEVKIIESKANNALSNKTSFEFFKNIKKHMQIKKLSRKSKQKTKEVEVSSLQNDTNYDSLALQRDRSIISVEENNSPELKHEDTAKNSDAISNNETLIATEVSKNKHISENLSETTESCSDTENKLVTINAQVTDKHKKVTNSEDTLNVSQSYSNNKTQQLEPNTTREDNIAEHQVENIEESVKVNTSNDHKVKASLTEELLKLSNYGWYWGPISGNEADAKLISEPDGAFLVRDSSDDRYVLTLSFKSSGKLLHARMEHSGGLFSLCNQSESEGFSSVAELIDYSMNFSQTAVFCYSRPKYPGHPSFPVRLTKPVSRFTQVRSLQYLCRFVIRQNTRLDNIHKLPLPKTIKGYIEEAHY